MLTGLIFTSVEHLDTSFVKEASNSTLTLLDHVSPYTKFWLPTNCSFDFLSKPEEKDGNHNPVLEVFPIPPTKDYINLSK